MMAPEPVCDSAPDGDQVAADPRLAIVQEDAASKRATEKRKAKLQKTLNKELSDAMADPLAVVEAAVTTGSSHEKSAAKQRRLALKEVLKAVSNPAMSLEERLKYLQAQYVREVASNTSTQQTTASLTALLEERTQEKAAAEKEVLRLRSNLEDLKRHSANVEETSAKMIKALQDHIQKQADTYSASVEEHQRLAQDLTTRNTQLVESSQSALDLVHKQKEDCDRLLAQAEEEYRGKLAGLQELYTGIDERLKKQSDMGKLVTEAQAQLAKYQKVEQELLVEKAHSQQLQKALEGAIAAQKDMTVKYSKLAKQHGSAMDTVTKTHTLVKSLSSDLEKHRAALPELLADRAAKEALAKQLAEAKAELGRTHLANQRLQGLCRALQGRKQDPDSEALPSCSEDASSSEAQQAAASLGLGGPCEQEACTTSCDVSTAGASSDPAAAAADASTGGVQQPQGTGGGSAAAARMEEQQQPDISSHAGASNSGSTAPTAPQGAPQATAVATASAEAAAGAAAQDAIEQCLEQAWSEVAT